MSSHIRADVRGMLATIFLAVFIVVPLAMTVVEAFRRPAPVPPPEPAPRYSMRDFRPPQR